jgi:membrane protein implicated in regulation of membrane protease activity
MKEHSFAEVIMDYIGVAWILVMIACMVIEGITLGLTTIWFAAGALVAWLTYKVGFGLNFQIIVFLIVSVLCLVLTRPIAIKKLKIGKIKTNSESLLGEYFKVESTIDNINSEGTVKVGGQLWSARSFDDQLIEKGEIVQVKEIQGVKLIVQRKNKTEV